MTNASQTTFASFETLNINHASVTEIEINRPTALNALNAQVMRELQQALTMLAQDPQLRCVIITGHGNKAFVAGADIKVMSQMSPQEALVWSTLGQSVFDQIEALPVPVLAAVNGYALGGGCELALACDVIYAAERAVFGLPEVSLGLMPGFGATLRLPRKIGVQAASAWIFTGETQSAQQAQAQGLVHEVCQDDMLLTRVRQVANIIAQRAPLSIRAAKLVMRQQTDAQATLLLERLSFMKLFLSKDSFIGMQAFINKQTKDLPPFTGA